MKCPSVNLCCGLVAGAFVLSSITAFSEDGAKAPPKAPNQAMQQRIDDFAVRTYDGGEASSIADLFKDLTSQGIDLNAKSSWGNSILEMAIFRGDLESVRLLLKSGVKIVETAPNGFTSLRAAAYTGQKDIASFLIEQGAVPDIFSATALARVDEVRRILERSPAQANATIARHVGVTPLMWAAYAGGQGKMDLFTPLWTGRLAIADLLIKKGANVNAITETGEVALGDAIGCRGVYPLAELLVKNGANVNVTNYPATFWTPLFTAAWFGDVAKAELLLRHGARVNARSNIGETPLHAAVRHSSTNVIGVLLAAGADTKLKDRDGVTPFEMARRLNLDEAVADIYIRHGIKLIDDPDTGWHE